MSREQEFMSSTDPPLKIFVLIVITICYFYCRKISHINTKTLRTGSSLAQQEFNWSFQGTKNIFKWPKKKQKCRKNKILSNVPIYLWTSPLSFCQHSSLCAYCGTLSPLPPTVNHHTGDISVITSPSPEEQHAQAFEEMGFSRAQAPVISQELLQTVWDAHWSWRPLKENAFEKRLKGQKSLPAFPLHRSRHSIDSVSLAQHWCGLMLLFFFCLVFHLVWLQHNTISDAQFPLLPFTFCIITSLDGGAVQFC